MTDITWNGIAHVAGFLLIFAGLCMVFSVALGWLEMQMFLVKKGPGYVNEFIGLYLVIGFSCGLFSCAIAFPAHLLIYFKAPRNRAKWYAAFASISASVAVWSFFFLLSR